MGKAIPGNLLRMWELLSDDIQDALLIAVERNRTAQRNFRGTPALPVPTAATRTRWSAPP
jgi:hypothetical protein